MKLSLKKIRLDGGTQTRARIYENIIDEYAEDMKVGATFPPLIVFHDGKDYWLGDGFHRWGAAMQLQLESIECEIRQGTLQDAQWYSFSANRANGMRRTNDDKVRAVKSALRHSANRSSNEIARHVGVHVDTVCKYREELESSGEIQPLVSPTDGDASFGNRKMSDPDDADQGQPARVVTRKGKTYQMKIGQIGKARKPRKSSLTPATPTRKLQEMVPMRAVNLSLKNPRQAARSMLSSFTAEYLTEFANELITALKERNDQ